MNRKASIVGGVILILMGILFLANEIAPQFFNFWEWPALIIGLGVLFFIWAIISGAGGLAVPGAILAGIGGLFYYQNMTGNWESWTYVWTIIPAFVGLGVIISGIINKDFKDAFSAGLILILISSGLFFAFGSRFGLPDYITDYWPLTLVVLGIIALIRAIFSKK